MAIQYLLNEHAVANASKMLASTGGEHIYNILMDKDTDQGSVVAKDAWQGMEYYSVKDSTGVKGLILEQAVNGNWYIEITEAGDGVFVCSVPLIQEEFTKQFQKESNFYNAKGDRARGYRMHEGDIVEVSAKGIEGTPAKGATVTVKDRKFTVGE